MEVRVFSAAPPLLDHPPFYSAIRRWMVIAVAATFTWCSLVAVSSAATGVQRLADAMSCTRPFKPEEILLGLQQTRVISSVPFNVIDGIPVFAVTKPFRIDGLKVKFVEGWDFQGNLFTRAPGTAPGTFLAVTVEGRKAYVETVEAKIADRSPPTPPDDRFEFYVTDDLAAYSYAKQDKLAAIVCVQIRP